MTYKALSNTQISFANLGDILDYIEAKFKQANPPISLNRNTALPLMAAPISGAQAQMMTAVFSESGAVVGVYTGYCDRSPVDGKRVCHCPIFLADNQDVVMLLLGDIDAFAQDMKCDITRIESHLNTPLPGITAQTMTYVKVT